VARIARPGIVVARFKQRCEHAALRSIIGADVLFWSASVVQISGVSMVSSSAGLPSYTPLLTSQHRAFEPEFRAIVASLPVRSGDRVLDLACGDGAFSRWFAQAELNVLAVDVSREFLKLAQSETRRGPYLDRVHLIQADFRRLPFDDDYFDLVWCAQSLYSLPDPLEAVQIMRRKTKPGGMVGVIENDEFHHVLLPWPIEIELALSHAELVAHVERSRKPRKFYVGRQLRGLFQAAGLTDCRVRSWTFDCQAPLRPHEREFLAHHLHAVRERARPHLNPEIVDDFERLVCPESDSYLLDKPDFAATCLNFVIWGTNPGGAHCTSERNDTTLIS
jgi:ubiquinone/menaquinone biosynthesis C-methylase UbiE